MASNTVQNFLFVNRGNGKFDEIGLMAEVTYSKDGRPRSGLGVDSPDVTPTGSVGGVIHSRLKTSGGSYLSSHDPRVIIGLGDASKGDWLDRSKMARS